MGFTGCFSFSFIPWGQEGGCSHLEGNGWPVTLVYKVVMVVMIRDSMNWSDK